MTWAYTTTPIRCACGHVEYVHHVVVLEWEMPQWAATRCQRCSAIMSGRLEAPR